jgi:hypothetical protein
MPDLASAVLAHVDAHPYTGPEYVVGHMTFEAIRDGVATVQGSKEARDVYRVRVVPPLPGFVSVTLDLLGAMDRASFADGVLTLDVEPVPVRLLALRKSPFDFAVDFQVIGGGA